MRIGRILGSLLVAATFIVVLGAPSPSEAVPVSFGTWFEFSWTGITQARGCQPADPGGLDCVPSGFPSSGGNSSFVGAPAWTFTSPDPVRLTVTDAGQAIDRFFVLDSAAFRGPTSAPSNNPGDSCGTDPVPCLADPRFSHGVFGLDPGAHSIDMIQILNEGPDGAGYFRLDPVPEPATLLLFGTTMAGLGLARWRRQRRE